MMFAKVTLGGALGVTTDTMTVSVETRTLLIRKHYQSSNAGRMEQLGWSIIWNNLLFEGSLFMSGYLG